MSERPALRLVEGEALLPWRVLALIAPGHVLAEVSDYVGVDPAGWRFVSGLWEQETQDGLFRLDLRDALLLWTPTWEGGYLPRGARPLPPRRIELDYVRFYLEWSGLELRDVEILAAAGWSPEPEPKESLGGYLALRGRLHPLDGARAFGDSFLAEFHCQGEVKAATKAEALMAAEAVLGLRRLAGPPRR